MTDQIHVGGFKLDSDVYLVIEAKATSLGITAPRLIAAFITESVRASVDRTRPRLVVDVTRESRTAPHLPPQPRPAQVALDAKRPRAPRKPHRSLTREELDRMRARMQQNATLAELAEEFDISVSTAFNWRKRFRSEEAA